MAFKSLTINKDISKFFVNLFLIFFIFNNNLKANENLSHQTIISKLHKVIENKEKKTLLLVEPCISSHLLILKAHEHGYNSIVISANKDSRKISSDVLDKATAFFQIDTNNIKDVLSLVKNISKNIRIDAVIPGAEYYVPLTAHISSFLQKKGLTHEASLRVRYKNFMRDQLKKDEVPIPRFEKVYTIKDIKKAVKKIGFPCVIKAVDFAGSVNVKKANNLKEAKDNFKEIIKLKGKDKGWGNRTIKKMALVEEYIEGPELSIEGFCQNKKIHIAAITQKLLSPEPDFVEVGHIIKPSYPIKFKKDIQSYLEKVVKSLGVAYGPFHAEVRLSSKGPILMEIAMRLGGDYIPKLVEYATGIDYYLNTFKLLLGENLDLTPTRSFNAGITFFYKPEIKRIYSNEKLLALKNLPHVKEVKAYYTLGALVPKLPMEKHKLGYAIIVHENEEKIREIMKKVEKEITF